MRLRGNQQARAAALAMACGMVTLACANVTSTPAMTREQYTVERFRHQVDEYMELRAGIVDDVGGLEASSSPAQLVSARQGVVDEIRKRRAGAMQGDILFPEVRTYFRDILWPILGGPRGPVIREKLTDDAPDPGTVPLAINTPYPAGLALPTTPALILRALPPLPRGVEYRIVGRDLLLLDTGARLIVDYMRNATPAAAAAATQTSP